MTDLGDVREVFAKWLHMPDYGAIYATLATVAANRLPGDPVWLALVGPPGSGKTEAVSSLSCLPDMHAAATLTEAALLSGTPKKEHAAGAKGGLLRQVGDFGIIVVKDFTSVLAMNRDSRSQVLAALREVYDGTWTRHVGTSGGLELHWAGKVGLIAGVTPTIDSHHAVIGAMGERLALYRLRPVDEDAQASRALDLTGFEHQMRAELAEVVADLFAGIDGWHLPPRDLSPAEHAGMVAMASLTVRARSAVERDVRTREVELVPPPEAPGRLVKVLRQVLAGLEVVGVPRDEAWPVLGELAMGCIPAVRRLVLAELVAAQGDVTTSTMAEALDYPTTTVRRTLEDLTAHGLAKRTGKGRAEHQWQVTTWTLERWPGGAFPEIPVPEHSLTDFQHREGGLSGKGPGTSPNGQHQAELLEHRP